MIQCECKAASNEKTLVINRMVGTDHSIKKWKQ